MRFAIILSRFNEHIGSKLLEGAKETLLKNGIADQDIETFFVPGAFEIPLIAKKLSETKKFDAVIALGCVIRGGTPHFDHICQQASAGIQQAALETGIPIAFGVVMAENAEQALERAGGAMGNKGDEAARTAIEMAKLLRNI